MTDLLDEFLDIAMPVLAPQMAEGRIVRWFVREGQSVEPGDLLAEVGFETATAEVEAKSTGRIASLLYAAGADGIKVHAPIARVQAKASVPDTTAKSPRTPDNAAHPTAASRSPDPAAPSTHPFDIALAGATTQLSYREALRDALSEAMAADPRVIILGEDVAQNRGAQRVTQGLVDAFGDARVVTLRPFDDAALSIAVGAALGGLRPIVEVSSWGTALEVITAALDTAAQVPTLSGGRASLPLIVRGPQGWTQGTSGLEAASVAERLVQIRGLKVVAPSSPAAAKLLLRAALREEGPVAILEAEDLYGLEGPVPVACPDTPMARAHVARRGSHLTLVSYGRLVSRALAAADRLEGEGVSVEVIDLVSLRPLDTETVKASLKSTRRLMVVEEGAPAFSIGAHLVTELAADATVALDRPPLRLCGWDGVIPSSSAYEAHVLPGEERIVSGARSLFV